MNYNLAVIHETAELETVFDAFSPSMPEKKTREYRTERMERLLRHLGNPERSYRTYHVAGSKGKGSTAAYIAALLTGYGERCGLYTSPHLYTIRERFTLSTSFFPEKLYTDTCSMLLEAVKDFRHPASLGPEKPTVFEMYTAYGYMLFREAGCTAAVIETGIGGRLDATNTINPEAVFLTPVELEHTDLLGDTIGKIAGEKAKIIRPGTPVFVSRQREEAAAVFRKEAELNAAPITFLDEAVRNIKRETAADGEHASFSIDDEDFSIRLSMATGAMAENAALAMLGAKRMSFLTEEGIRLLEKTQLPGRFEKRIIGGHLVIADTAHTPASAASSVEAVNALSGGREASLVFALTAGKDAAHILRVLLPRFEHVIISRPGTYKKNDPHGLWAEARRMFPEKDIRLVEDPDEALDSALALSSDILVTGSFYLAGEMEKLRKGNEP